jgi:hypothetical protein
MQAEEIAINFRMVAARAGVSTAWLYSTKPLRDRIVKLRDVSKTPAQNDTNHRRLIAQERVIATITPWTVMLSASSLSEPSSMMRRGLVLDGMTTLRGGCGIR